MWRLVYALPLILLMFLIKSLLTLIGWIVVPIAAACKAYEPYKGYDGVGNPRLQYRFTWRFMWLWDNEEDGIANDTYWNASDFTIKFKIFKYQFERQIQIKNKWLRMFLQIVYWSANRNPVNNLRYVKYLKCDIDPKKVKWIGNLGDGADPKRYDLDSEVFKLFCWHGVYSNIRIQYTYKDTIRRFWIGWKIYPEDSLVDTVTGYRANGAGFAIQHKKCWPK